MLINPNEGLPNTVTLLLSPKPTNSAYLFALHLLYTSEHFQGMDGQYGYAQCKTNNTVMQVPEQFPGPLDAVAFGS